MPKVIPLQAVWPDLQNGVQELLTKLTGGMSPERWMSLFKYVRACMGKSNELCVCVGGKGERGGGGCEL